MDSAGLVASELYLKKTKKQKTALQLQKEILWLLYKIHKKT